MYQGDGEQSYQAGHIFAYPEDAEKLCPWLLDGLSRFIEALQAGETLGWRYEGTPCEKVVDPDGVTTEFVRCADPMASGIVVKLIRTCPTRSWILSFTGHKVKSLRLSCPKARPRALDTWAAS